MIGRRRVCPHCETRFCTQAELAHCVACGCPTWPHHSPKPQLYSLLFVTVNGIALKEESPCP